MAGKIIEQNSDKSLIQAELSFEKPNGFGCSYRADLVKDGSKTLQLKGSCGASKEFVFVKYAVTNLRLVAERLVCLNT